MPFVFAWIWEVLISGLLMVKVSTEDCHAAESGGEPGCERPHDVPPGAGVFDDDVERAALAQHPDPFELLRGADGEVEHDALVSEGSEGGDAHEQAKLHDEGGQVAGPYI